MRIDYKTLYIIRKVYGLSCATVGDLLGVSGAYVNMIERNKRPLTPNIRDKLIVEFDLSLEKLARIYEIYNEIHAEPAANRKYSGLRPVLVAV